MIYLLVVLSVLDAITTYVILENGGHEVNPVVSYLIYHMGNPAILYLLATRLICFYYMWNRVTTEKMFYYGTVVGTIVYSLVIISNLYLVMVYAGWL